jgi:ribosome-associated translation inhibitor RaiA
VEIIFQAHHATISDRLRARAERAVAKAARRLGRVADAVVRFEGDGPTRRVEIVLRSPRNRSLVAEGRSRYYGPALAAAVDRLIAQIPKKDAPRSRRPVTRARARLGAAPADLARA